MRGNALVVELVRGDQLIRERLDELRQRLLERARREAAMRLGSFARQGIAELLRPVGRGHHMATNRLGQGAEEARDELSAQARHLPVESTVLDLGQQRAHLVVDAGDQRVPSRHRRGLSGHANIGAAYIAVADDLRQHKLRGVAGDGETDALRAVDDGGVDADDLAVHVEERTAGIALVDGGVGLNVVVVGT